MTSSASREFSSVVGVLEKRTKLDQSADNATEKLPIIAGYHFSVQEVSTLASESRTLWRSGSSIVE